MPRKPFIAGNWKMSLATNEASQLAMSIASTCSDLSDRDVLIAPSFTALHAVADAIKGSDIILAGQNVCWEEQGAYTGEISPAMLRDLGCTSVIIGHSERRTLFGETDQLVNKRLTGALAHGINPILCVGETLEEREQNITFEVLEKQMRIGLDKVDENSAHHIVIAYEPVWAIGTGKTASNEQAQEVHAFLRQLLAQIYKKGLAASIRILYGGSVKPENIDSLMVQPDIDGALVGGAALNAQSFERIVKFK
ncbi:MAG: triose-phosphate isomerase [Desulfobulbaceae bacterium]|nr:triose-phosphate isomerase [Desulfobulbaceae bacterium]